VNWQHQGWNTTLCLIYHHPDLIQHKWDPFEKLKNLEKLQRSLCGQVQSLCDDGTDSLDCALRAVELLFAATCKDKKAKGCIRLGGSYAKKLTLCVDELVGLAFEVLKTSENTEAAGSALSLLYTLCSSIAVESLPAWAGKADNVGCIVSKLTSLRARDGGGDDMITTAYSIMALLLQKAYLTYLHRSHSLLGGLHDDQKHLASELSHLRDVLDADVSRLIHSGKVQKDLCSSMESALDGALRLTISVAEKAEGRDLEKTSSSPHRPWANLQISLVAVVSRAGTLFKTQCKEPQPDAACH